MNRWRSTASMNGCWRACSSVISPWPDRSWKLRLTSVCTSACVLPRCRFVSTVAVGLYGENALRRFPFGGMNVLLLVLMMAGDIMVVTNEAAGMSSSDSDLKWWQSIGLLGYWGVIGAMLRTFWCSAQCSGHKCLLRSSWCSFVS